MKGFCVVMVIQVGGVEGGRKQDQDGGRGGGLVDEREYFSQERLISTTRKKPAPNPMDCLRGTHKQTCPWQVSRVAGPHDSLNLGQ